MPDVTDTGTIIGQIRPQQPPQQQLSLSKTPVLVPPDDTAAASAMDVDSTGADETMMIDDDAETIDEGEALLFVEKLRGDDLPSRVPPSPSVRVARATSCCPS